MRMTQGKTHEWKDKKESKEKLPFQDQQDQSQCQCNRNDTELQRKTSCYGAWQRIEAKAWQTNITSTKLSCVVDKNQQPHERLSNGSSETNSNNSPRSLPKERIDSEVSKVLRFSSDSRCHRSRTGACWSSWSRIRKWNIRRSWKQNRTRQRENETGRNGKEERSKPARAAMKTKTKKKKEEKRERNRKSRKTVLPAGSFSLPYFSFFSWFPPSGLHDFSGFSLGFLRFLFFIFITMLMSMVSSDPSSYSFLLFTLFFSSSLISHSFSFLAILANLHWLGQSDISGSCPCIMKRSWR